MKQIVTRNNFNSSIEIPTISFCITCKNRFHQISKTLRKNLEDNRLHNDWIEFIVVDFGSKDGLGEWIKQNFKDDLISGYLKYIYTDELLYWHASIGKNTAHYCASNHIVVNLDCDNFIGSLGAKYVISNYLKNRNIVFHQFSGNYTDGSYGRISVYKEYFDLIGGYDESLEPVGFEDTDLIDRLIMIGLVYFNCSNTKYCSAISNTKEEGILYANTKLDFNEMNEINRFKSNLNIREGKIVTSNRIYGIRKNLYDHNENIFVKSNN